MNDEKPRRSRDVACPACGSQPGYRCTALTTGRGTDDHAARYDAYLDALYGPVKTRDES